MKEKNYSIQFLRFLLAIIICYGHFLWVTPYQNVEMYANLKAHCANSFFAVEYFFIISGYFLFFSSRTIKDFVKQKIIRIWPLLAFSILVGICIGMKAKSCDLATLFFLQGTGISQKGGLNGPAWFVCVLFWVSLIYHIVLKNMTNKIKRNIFFLSVFLVSFFLLIKNLFIFPRAIMFGFLSIMMVRGFACIALGVLCAILNKEILIPKLSKKLSFDSCNNFFKILNSTIEILLFSVVMYYCFSIKTFGYPYDQILVIFVFCALVLSFVNKSGVLSARILNNKFVNFLGEISFPIYLMQYIVFFEISKSYSRHLDGGGHSIAYWMIYFIVVGILAYFIVEKPKELLIKKMEKGNINLKDYVIKFIKK